MIDLRVKQLINRKEMDSNFIVTEDYYTINLGLNDKVIKEEEDLWNAWEEYFDFIRASHKQMADVLINNIE